MNGAEREASGAQARLGDIDAIRTLLTVLVILVHASVTYGGEGSWYYKEPGAGMPVRIVLTLFNAICQSFFMGLFFFLAGYFTPGAYARKGGRAFLRDRALRLGLPLLAFDFLLEPVTVYLRDRAELAGRPIGALYLHYLRDKDGLGAGPLWFVELLLLFAAVYAAWRAVAPPPAAPRSEPPPRWWALLLFAAGLGLGTFVVRLRFPIGSVFEPMNLQLPFALQYVCMFPAGVVAWHRGWLATFRTGTGGGWLGAAAVAALALPILMATGGGLGGELATFMGGAHWQAFALALWESVACVAFCRALLRLFGARHGPPGRLERESARGAYGVYIIHAPVLVGVSVAMRSAVLPAGVKFVLVAAMVVPLCFLLAASLRRLPGLRQIL